MTPDPDLGWKRLSHSVAPPVGGTATGAMCTNPVDWSNSLPRGATTSLDQQRRPESRQPLYPLPHAWNVFFFNDRSGHFCQVSIIILAINIATRADRLAKTFGIVSDPVDLSGRTKSAAMLEGTEYAVSQDSHHQIYSALRVPDVGWRLLKRRGDEMTRQGSERFRKSRMESRGQDAEAEKRLSLQLIQRGTTGDTVWADVAEIGMNIAEQLYRLERRHDNRHFLPTDSFGWVSGEGMDMQDNLKIAVSNKEGEAFWLIPEELIMNVTQWVQQTYLTSTAF